MTVRSRANIARITAHENNLSRLYSDISACADRNSNIRRRECRCVVYTIANHSHSLPAGLSGVRRFMVDQITNPQLDFDMLLKMASFRAALYGAAGRLDEAFDCLDQAIAYRDPALVHLAVAPEWDNMRGDPRFAERLRSMALPSAAHDNIGN